MLVVIEPWLKSRWAFLGRTMLDGLDLDRLERWNGDDNRRFFFPSLGLSKSTGIVARRWGVDTSSGSSDASREEGIESDRRSYITNQHMYSWNDKAKEI